MKKHISLVLLAAFVVSNMSGCAAGPSPTATPMATTPTSVLVPPTPAPPSPTPMPPAPTPTPMPEGRTILVTSAADSGPGTLRQALEDAEPYDLITFDPSVFPPNAPETIAVTSELPQISQGHLTVDASDEGVILDGSNIPSTGDEVSGLEIHSDGNVVQGLQIVGFSVRGIGLFGGAKHNLIGGDRGIGTGPLGQGNLISGNGNFGISLSDEGTSHNTIQGNYIGINLDGTSTWGHPRDGIHSNGANHNLITDNVIGGNGSGVYLCCVADGHNTVTANIIGTDASGEIPLGNQFAGVHVDRTSYNVVGPGNIIARNDRYGILFWEDTPDNTVTQNNIHDNGELGIDVHSSSEASRYSPLIFEFDLQAGSLTGLACANCIVEVFSDSSDEGGIYEGQAVADSNGFFTLSKGLAFTGPHLTATATSPDGSTTEFSHPTRGASGTLSLQEGNALVKLQLHAKPSRELADNRIGNDYGGFSQLDNIEEALPVLLEEFTALGVKRVHMGMHEAEPPIDWSTGSEFVVPAAVDRFIDGLVENGVAMNLLLHFWDKEGHAAGEELSTPRFKTEEQVQDFLEYVRFLARHFKGRVQYYQIWTEPEICSGSAIKCIKPPDYIDLARRTIPVIREEDPQAKVVSAPNVLYFARDYLFAFLDSDVVQLFDVISWHPMYDAAPDIEFYGDYYHEYPSIIRAIKDTASASGFQGEYWGTDLTWWIAGDPGKPADQPWESHTEIQSAKYYARVTVTQLGLDVGVGVQGLTSWEYRVRWIHETMRNLCTVMAGARPDSLAVEIESAATNIASYGFTLSNGDMLCALWTDGAAVDDDPGVRTTLTFSGLSAQEVIGIDVLNGFEQELITETENGNLVIRDLLVKDYPIIVRVTD